MNRNASLDGLRAIAAIMVVAFHSKIPFMGKGHIGVDVFFVLSGFLISGLILKEFDKTGALNYWRFSWRRLKRLYPAMLVMLVVVWLVSPFFFAKYDRTLEFFLSAAYISNWARILGGQPIVTQHTWSLALEVQFYLLWPIILIGLRVVFNKNLLSALVSLLVILIAWRIWLQYSGQSARGRIYSSLDGRAASLVFGAVIAVIPWRPSAKAADLLGLISALVLVMYATGVLLVKYKYAYLPAFIVELAAATLILSLTAPKGFISRGFSYGPLPLLGLWSYSLYLWHYPIARIARENLPPYEAFVITITASLILAALSYYLIEQPIFRRHKKTTMPTAVA